MAPLIFVSFYFLLFFQKSSKGRAPISRDSKIHFKLRGRVVQGLGPIEALTQPQGEQQFPLLTCVLWCKLSCSVVVKKNYFTD